MELEGSLKNGSVSTVAQNSGPKGNRELDAGAHVRGRRTQKASDRRVETDELFFNSVFSYSWHTTLY